MAETKILSCTCSHKYQDETYGKGQRLHNRVKSDPANPQFRCAVCSKQSGAKQS